MLQKKAILQLIFRTRFGSQYFPVSAEHKQVADDIDVEH
jgi:hypothetical protein